MIKTKVANDNKLPGEIYIPSKTSKSLWVIILLTPFLLALILNFPLRSTLILLVQKNLSHLPCPIRYSSIELEFLLPKIIIKNPTIPGHCFNRPLINIGLPYLHLNFRGPGVYPFGAKFLISTKFEQTPINLYYTLAFSKSVLKLEETKFDISTVTKLFSLPKIAGHLELTSLIALNHQGKLNELDLLIKSKDLKFPSQNIQGLQIPTLTIGNLLIKASMDQTNKKSPPTFDLINIPELIIGHAQSPIIAQFGGKFLMNINNFQSSQLQLKGETKFSENFLKEFAILNLFLNKFQQKNQYYSMQITGPLHSIRVIP